MDSKTAKGDAIGGYFCWRQVNGKLYRVKYDLEGEKVFGSTKLYYSEHTVARHAITEFEYESLSLDELAVRYPLSEEIRKAYDDVAEVLPTPARD